VLAGNQVVFGFAAMEEEDEDIGGYAGWVMAYNKTNFGSKRYLRDGDHRHQVAVCAVGRPPVVDSSGYVYVFVGNGYTAATTECTTSLKAPEAQSRHGPESR